MVVLLIYIGLLGLVIGSFSNVVIYRVPMHQSLVSPASHCPHCDHDIRYRDNVPVVSWLVLRGKCSYCRGPIAARYPLVELGVCAVFVAVCLRLAALDLLPALAAFLYVAAVGVVLALIDIDTRRLPDVIVLPSYVVTLVLLVVASAWQQEWGGLERALLGAVALFCFYFLTALVYPAGMGFGDVKLSGILGAILAYISWGTLVVGAFSGFLLGALAGVAMMFRGTADRKTALPFGPFMVAGALVAVFVGNELADAYLATLR